MSRPDSSLPSNLSHWLLVFDANPALGAMVYGVDGVLLYHNHAALCMFVGSRQTNHAGSHINELFHPDFAAERLAWCQLVVESHVKLQVDHVLNGHRIRSTFVPIQGHAKPLVLVLSRLVKGDDFPQDCDTTVVKSKFIDLGRFEALTTREFQTLVYLGHGLSIEEVARELGISPKTIEKHNTSIRRKLGDRTANRVIPLVTQAGLRVEDLALQAIRVSRSKVEPPTLPSD